mmetsp:Transcript_38282/g.50213  ORF Transcript_38282/g.50213 Transcript_38282/m.50213 type:complete len:84 (+) Transcript_38282:229-480(+)
MFRVNPKHRITEEKALSLPMHRKLRMHFAENACKQALGKLWKEDVEFKRSFDGKGTASLGNEDKDKSAVIEVTKPAARKRWND